MLNPDNVPLVIADAFKGSTEFLRITLYWTEFDQPTQSVMEIVTVEPNSQTKCDDTKPLYVEARLFETKTVGGISHVASDELTHNVVFRERIQICNAF